MNTPKPPAESEPVNERNWYKKMKAAEKAYPHAQDWRKQFTRQELEIIDREMDREFRWAVKAVVNDLPGPRRFDAIVD